MKNIETPDKIHLSRLIDDLRYGKHIIPDFQREFEWHPRDVVELIRSIFEDYYIGTLLFWRSSKENQNLLNCEPIYGFDGKNNPEHIVLDGQQRLSALYYVFFAPDKPYPKRKSRCFFFIQLKALLEENFNEAFYYNWESNRVLDLISKRDEQFKEKILPLCIFGESSYAWVKWLEQYQKYWTEKIGPDKARAERNRIENFLKDLIEKYDVSYIELDRNIEVFKVCDIFARINSTGMQLTIFDLLNATLRPKEIYLKDMWRDVSADLNVVEAEKMRVYLLQTMSILKQGYCSPRYLYYLVPESQKTIKLADGSKKKIILISSKEEFIKLWDFVAEKVKETIKTLQNPRDFGAITPKFIPYPSMIPIITALNIEKRKENYQQKQDVKEKIRKWYWSSVFTKNYSSAVESQMTKDFYELQKWFIDDKKIPNVVNQCINEINYLDLKSENSQSSAVYKAIFNILIQKGAKDLNTFELPEYSQLEDHHIVPCSWGEKRVGKDINSILNRTPLSSKTNKEIIKERLPNIYLRKMLDKTKNKEDIYKLLESHLISRKAVEILLREDFSKNDYYEFIEERKKTIMKEVKKILRIQEELQKRLISPEMPFSNKLQVEHIIKSCEGYLYWFDKYFSKVGLEILTQALYSSQRPNINEIKILTSIDKTDLSLRKSFKDFKKEFENKDIKVELRVIVESKMKSKIHDRWIISGNKCFNIPSTDTVASGQYSEIKETKNKPPFEEWWDKGLDIITDWDKIEKSKR